MLREAGFVVHDEGDRRVRHRHDHVGRPGRPERAGSVGAADAPPVSTPSTTMAGSSRYDVERRNLPPMLRLSVHYTTTTAELVDTVEILTHA